MSFRLFIERYCVYRPAEGDGFFAVRVGAGGLALNEL